MKNKEWSFLINICTNFVLNNVDLNSIFVSIKKDFDWESFHSFAYHHRVIAIVYNELDKLKDIHVPKPIWEQMTNYYREIIQNNLTQTNELIKLTKIFNSNGLEFVPYKGVTLSHFVYENIGNRPSVDLDIMIDLKCLNKIKTILNQNNYQYPNHLSDRLYKNHLKNNCEISVKKKLAHQYIYIDKHWRISNPMLQMNIGFIEMKKESKYIDFFGTKINYLSPEAHFIIIAMHHYGKEKIDLKQIIDLAMIIKKYKSEITWAKLVTLSKQWKVFKLTLYSLNICNKALTLSLPKEIVKLIEDNCDEKFINKQLNILHDSKGKFEHNTKDNFLRRIKLHLKIRDDYQTKLKIIYHHLLTILIPSETDFKDPKKATTFKWCLTFFIKPFFLFYRTFIVSK